MTKVRMDGQIWHRSNICPPIADQFYRQPINFPLSDRILLHYYFHKAGHKVSIDSFPCRVTGYLEVLSCLIWAVSSNQIGEKRVIHAETYFMV